MSQPQRNQPQPSDAEDRTSHWATPEEAAQVLAAALRGFTC